MSDDEGFAMFIAAILAVIGLRRWCYPLLATPPFGHASGMLRLPLLVVPPACLLLIGVVFSNWAARDIRDDGSYELLFILVGAAWMTMTDLFSCFVGISLRDDVIERRNSAAAVAVGSAIIASAIIYAGANIGEGPTIWTTIFPAAMASAVLAILWLFVETTSRIADAIACDHDLASGIRLAAFLLGSSVVLGRSVAGDFQSWPATWHDLAVQGWPAVPLAIYTAIAHRRLRPSPGNLHPSAIRAGCIPAIFPILAAGGWLAYLGRWH